VFDNRAARWYSAIMAAFESEPDNAFLLSELCEHAYPRIKASRKSIASL